jgi:hypothetical protein
MKLFCGPKPDAHDEAIDLTMRTLWRHIVATRNAPANLAHHNRLTFRPAPKLDPHTGDQIGWAFVRCGVSSNTIWKEPTPSNAKRSWELTFDVEHDRWEKWNGEPSRPRRLAQARSTVRRGGGHT